MLQSRCSAGSLCWRRSHHPGRDSLDVASPTEGFSPCKFNCGVLCLAAVLALGGRAGLHPSSRLQEQGRDDSRAHAASLPSSCRSVILVEDLAPGWPLLSSRVPALGHDTWFLGQNQGFEQHQLSPPTATPPPTSPPTPWSVLHHPSR